MRASHAKGAVARPLRLLVSEPSNLSRPTRVARQSCTVEGAGSKPVSLATDHLLRHEVHGNQLAHVVISKSAGKPGWPALAQHS